MQTLRKLPTTAPKMKAINKIIMIGTSQRANYSNLGSALARRIFKTAICSGANGQPKYPTQRNE